ncbi:uncharacterized protein LOC141719642 isoform X1 [Apium graveolens]|uniref:uncharacterized protein LOC141719642 isoform X1 n=1 Tax=Apium graveolens TaxID=4045 RepID=UPI003D79D339
MIGLYIGFASKTSRPPESNCEECRLTEWINLEVNYHITATRMDCTEQVKCDKLGPSSSFCRMIYAEIEEVGWEHLLRLGEDFMCLSFRVRDKKGRVHVMEIMLDKTYPKCPPLISADVPYILTLEWLTNYRLKNVVKQFQEHLEKLQEFWSTLGVIDHDLWVVYPKPPMLATCYRQINMGDDCFLMLFISATDPRSLPECRFTGSDQKVNLLTRKWRRNCKRWMKDKPLPENLTNIFDMKLPGPPSVHINDQQTECGICYAQYLPMDVELGSSSGSSTDYTCDNKACNRAFHSICLGDWLLTLTTTRQSFDVLFGNCPYCSDPVAIKVNVKK